MSRVDASNAETTIRPGTDEPTADDRIAALEDEVRGIKERAAAAADRASNADARDVGNSVAGQP